MRKNLVVCPVNSRDSCHVAYSSADRNYDIFLINYTETDIDFSGTAEKVFNIKGFKFPTIYNLIESGEIDVYQYDTFWFTDYDVEISRTDLNSLFNIAKLYDFNVSQPSLTPSSYKSWQVTENNESCKYRLTNFVEIMCPMFSRSALLKLKHTFNLAYSGWGIDFLWANLLNNSAMAIIDLINVKHIKPIESDKWVLPNGKTAHQELDDIMATYNLNISECFPKVLHYETI